MVVRIRFGNGPKVARRRGKNQRVALTLAALLTPAAFTASIMAVWSIAASLNWTNSFAFSTGILSHWQVWLAAAAGLQLFARLLNRYGKAADQAAS
jgi:hypothetical protein